MYGGVVAVTAERVRRIAVRLDIRRERALEASRARRELNIRDVSYACKSDRRTGKTYAGGLACPDVEAQSRDVTRVTHEDSGSDLLLRRRRDRDSSVRESLVEIATTTIHIVEDLSALRVPNEHDERVRALRVEGVDLVRRALDALDDRVGVVDAAA